MCCPRSVGVSEEVRLCSNDRAALAVGVILISSLSSSVGLTGVWVSFDAFLDTGSVTMLDVMTRLLVTVVSLPCRNVVKYVNVV